jgi:hypothetical protein
MKFVYIFSIKNCNLLVSKLQEKPSALKRENPVLQKMKFINFFLCLWFIFALLVPNSDPDPGTPIESGSTILLSTMKRVGRTFLRRARYLLTNEDHFFFRLLCNCSLALPDSTQLKKRKPAYNTPNTSVYLSTVESDEDLARGSDLFFYTENNLYYELLSSIFSNLFQLNSKT